MNNIFGHELTVKSCRSALTDLTSESSTHGNLAGLAICVNVVNKYYMMYCIYYDATFCDRFVVRVPDYFLKYDFVPYLATKRLKKKKNPAGDALCPTTSLPPQPETS